MEDQDKGVKETAEVETADVTPDVEETPETQETPPEESEESTKKGYSNRVRELNQRTKEAEAKAESLQEKLAELTAKVKPGESVPNFEPLTPLVNPGEEITVDELNKRQVEREKELMKRAAEISGLQAKQISTVERINREAKESITKHPELDPNSQDFDRELSETLTEAAEAYVRANPDKSLADFVDKQMKLHKRAVSKEEKAEKEEIAKQSSESAVRPTPAKTEEKKFEDLSIDEMEKRLGFFQQ